MKREDLKTIEKALKRVNYGSTIRRTISRSERQDDGQYRRVEKSSPRNVRSIFYSCHVDQSLAPWALPVFPRPNYIRLLRVRDERVILRDNTRVLRHA